MVKPKHSARQRRRAYALANGDVSSHIAVGMIVLQRLSEEELIELAMWTCPECSRADVRLGWFLSRGGRRSRLN